VNELGMASENVFDATSSSLHQEKARQPESISNCTSAW
jgi:hypothetical protein